MTIVRTDFGETRESARRLRVEVAGDVTATNVQTALQGITIKTPAAAAIEFVIGTGSSPVTTGVQGYIEMPFAATINAARMLATPAGSIVVDIWRCTFAQFDGGNTHPVAADSITGGNPLTISAAVSVVNTSLAGWTVSLNAGDVLAFDVVSASTVSRATVSLDVTKN